MARKLETILHPYKSRQGGWLKTTKFLGLKISRAFWGTDLKSAKWEKTTVKFKGRTLFSKTKK